MNEIKGAKRLVAAARLTDIKNELEGFTSTNKARAWSDAFRGRSRTIWDYSNRPSAKGPRSYSESVNASMRVVHAYMNEKNDEVEWNQSGKVREQMETRRLQQQAL